jgi:hypothetical protein
LAVFVGLADDWDEHPQHRPEIDQRIRGAARDYLARP